MRRLHAQYVWRRHLVRVLGGNVDNGDARDNNENIKQILALRAERAKLFGLPTHAHWILQQKMAKTPENAIEPTAVELL